MKYNDIIKNIENIKKERADYISSFDTEYTHVYESLVNARQNSNLKSIRIHKYLTNNKKLGKVNTARYLEKIGLNETMQIKTLNDELISKIAEYCNEQ